MKKTFKILILFAVLCCLFSISVYAKSSFDGFTSDTNVRKCQYYRGGQTGLNFNNEYVDIIIVSEYISSAGSYLTKEIILLPNYYDISLQLIGSSFANSGQTACEYLGITTASNTWLNSFYNSDTVYTNFQATFDYINHFGYICKDYLNYILENDLLQRELDTLREEYDILIGDYERLQAEFRTLKQDYNLLAVNHEDALNRLTEALYTIDRLTSENKSLTSEVDRLVMEYEELEAYSNHLYTQAYNAGLADGGALEDGFKTIFSAPLYVFATVFDFEIFGVNFFTLIKFMLSVTLIAFVVRRFI